jgi:zinc protease
MQNRYRINPTRVPVIGYQEVIQGLSRDDVYQYYKLAYQPNNLVFAIAGDVEPRVMLAAVQKQMKDAAPGREFQLDLPPEPPVAAPRGVVATFPKLSQAKFDIAFPTVVLDHPDMYPLDVLATVLGGGESSILVEELRDHLRLVSSVGASDWTPQFADGTFSMSMELDASKIDMTTVALLDILEKLKTDLIDPARIERAKTQMRASRLKGLQKSESIISSLATDFLSSGDPHFSDHYVERIQSVSAEQIRDVVRKYFDRRQLLTTALVPADDDAAIALPKAEDLLRRSAQASSAAATKPDAAASAETHRVVLPGGIVLLHKKLSTTPIVETRMYALGGLTAEQEQTNGLGNFAMSILPRGTSSRNARQIAEFFDSIGGDLDTGCGNNSWYWNMTSMREDLGKAMEIYADVVNHPSFSETEINAMKPRLAAAIDGQDSDWYSQATRFFRKSFFAPMKSPYQFTALGDADVIAKASPEQLKNWYEQNVLPAPRVLAIYGDVDLAEAQKLAEQYFGQAQVAPIPSAPAVSRNDSPVKSPSIHVSRVEVQKTEQPLAGVIIGFNSNSVIGEPDIFPRAVADTMTSGFGYPTGYLHEILRGRGLVYVVHAIDMPGRDAATPGTFLVYAGCDPANVNEVVDIILENIARCQGTDADMNTDWFDRSKQLIATGDALTNETAAEQATTATLDELYGLGFKHHDEFPARIKRVTIDEVRRIAQSQLRDAVVTISTPKPEAVSRATGLREYPKFPPVDLTPKGVQHDAGR